MADNREALWKDDESLKETLSTHIKQGLQRKEILDFVTETFLSMFGVLDHLTGAFDTSKYIIMTITLEFRMLSMLFKLN